MNFIGQGENSPPSESQIQYIEFEQNVQLEIAPAHPKRLGPVEKVGFKSHFLDLETEKIGFQKLFAKNRKFELVHINGRWLVS